MRPALEELEDRTLPAPIGSIDLSLSGVVQTTIGAPASFGPSFYQTKSIDPSVGQVSINGSSSLSGTNGSVTEQYTVTGSATAIPPSQGGQPYEGDITIDSNWNFASLPTGRVVAVGNYSCGLNFNVPGTFTLTYVTSQSTQFADDNPFDFQNGSDFSFVDSTLNGHQQTLPTTGSGTITFSIPASGSVGITMGSSGFGGIGGSVSDQESFHWTFTPSSSSVTPTSMSWDTTQGGLNYGYTVNGASPLSQDTPAALYWSKSASFSDNLGKINGTDYTIPAGTAGNASYNQHVDGKLLRDAPQGTNYLLVVIGDPNDPKDVKALKDVSITFKDARAYPPANYLPVSAHSLETIKGLLREAGQGDKVAVISSTVRTPHQQAVAMFRNLEIGRKQNDNTGRNYTEPAYDVVRVYDALRDEGVTDQGTIVAAMEAKIIEIKNENPDVFKHVATPEQWARLQAIDIDPNSIRNPDLFDAAGYGAENDGRLSNFQNPANDDPAYHLEIPQG
jgi:hypothetical protein